MHGEVSVFEFRVRAFDRGDVAVDRGEAAFDFYGRKILLHLLVRLHFIFFHYLK